MSINGEIFDIQRFCLHDGPGVRTVFFLKGCPLRCEWCSNPESQELYPEIMYINALCIKCGKCLQICPTEAVSVSGSGIKINRLKCTVCGACVPECPPQALRIVGKKVKIDSIFDELMRDKPFFDTSGGGITLSGGEPLLQVEFVHQLLKRLKTEFIHTAVETSGAVPWDSIKKILGSTDLFLVDLKHSDSGKHKKATGTGNELILQNIKKLTQTESRVILRIPLIPSFNMEENNIIHISEIINEYKIDEVHLLPYHRLGIGKYLQLNRVPTFHSILPLDKNQILKAKSFFNRNTNARIVIER